MFGHIFGGISLQFELWFGNESKYQGVVIQTESVTRTVRQIIKNRLAYIKRFGITQRILVFQQS